MRIPRIFTTQALALASTVELEAGPSAHVVKALRMRIGDGIVLFNGLGGEYSAEIISIDKKSIKLNVLDHCTQQLESPLLLELGISISRGDRMDWIIQKATELGATSIAPLTTLRSEVKLKGERAEKRQRHWQQVIISACEQCGRNQIPQLHALASLGSWIPRVGAERKFVLHHRDTSVTKTDERPNSVAILVGPEGGLSDNEIADARQYGFEALTLGPRILRTETAPLAAIAILQARWGDMPLELSNNQN